MGLHYSSTLIRYCTFKISHRKKAAYVFFMIFLFISIFSILFYRRYYFLSLILVTLLKICRSRDMQIILSWIILFRFRCINGLFSFVLPTAHIYVTKIIQTEIHLTKLLVLVLFFSCLLFTLLSKTVESI